MFAVLAIRKLFLTVNFCRFTVCTKTGIKLRITILLFKYQILVKSAACLYEKRLYNSYIK